MEPTPDPGAAPTPTRSKRSWIMTAAVATGLAVGAAGLAGAATGGSSGSSSTTAPSGYAQAPSGQAPSGPPAGMRDPAAMPNGPGETVLTGDAAEKAKAAALAAVPGATVIRVETDSGDAEYEAHLQKADGTTVTVLMDAEFTVTSTEDGFGPGGPGGPHGGPGRPGDSTGSTDDSSSSSSSATN